MTEPPELKQGDQGVWKGVTWDVNHVDGRMVVLRALIGGVYRFRVVPAKEVEVVR
ncbi:MAG: hypothetical protein Q8O40_09890 [Chloroflexota bacterium]|nr:hypothetical protein [Chloroflexota bacterium]